MGQLVLKNETFYIAEEASTLFYENTIPIWKSVYEGNWQKIGEIIRKIADESVRDLDVLATTWTSFRVNSSVEAWILGNTENSPDFLAIPYMLVKAIVDIDNYQRGIIYHTFNDPHLNVTIAKQQTTSYCYKTIDCSELHPEFENALKGYTFCCYLEDSCIFDNMHEDKSPRRTCANVH